MRPSIWISLVIGTLLVAGCAPQRNETRGIFRWSQERPQFDQAKLDRLYLEKKWDLPLVGQGEEIREMYFHRDGTPGGRQDLLFVVTNLNWVYAIDARQGFTLWRYKLPLGLSHAPGVFHYPRRAVDLDETAEGEEADEEEADNPLIFEPHKYDEVFLVSKDTIHVLDVKGNELAKLRAPALPATPASGNERYVFFGGYDDRVYAIEKETGLEKWRWLCDAPVHAGPLYVSQPGQPGKVIVTSEDSTVYAFDPAIGKPKPKDRALEDRDWLFPTRGPVMAGAAHAKTFTFVGSTDHSGYALDYGWNLVWRMYCGAPIVKDPVVIRTRNSPQAGSSYISHTVYFFTDDGQFHAREYNKPTTHDAPNVLSWTAKGEQILSKGIRYLYVLDEEQTLYAIDNDAGHVKWRGDFTQGVDHFVTNDRGPYIEGAGGALDVDEMAGVIYLAYRQGWVVALREKSVVE